MPGRFNGLPLEDWDRVISVYTRAAWLLAKAAYPALKEARGARVATGSINGSFPHAGQGAYAAAKAALPSLCQTLGMEWASDGIRVNVVSPVSHAPVSMRLCIATRYLPRSAGP